MERATVMREKRTSGLFCLSQAVIMRFHDRRGHVVPLARVFAEHLDAVTQRLDWIERLLDGRRLYGACSSSD
jgi:hypothetical protein